MKRRALIVLAYLVAACTTVTPSPTATGNEPGPSPVTSVAPAPTPSATPEPALPTQTAAHLRWVKTRTNLPPRVAHNGFKLAMRPGDPPLYVLMDAFLEVWTSTDGTDWSMVTKLEPYIRTQMDATNLLVFFDDRFVALDQDFDPIGAINFDGPYENIAAGHTWVSSDGRSWSAHATPVAFRSGVIDHDRIVGVGGLPKQYTATFASSPDGETWTSTSLSGDPWPIPNPPQTSWWIDHLAGDRIDGFVVAASEARYGRGNSCSSPTITPPLPTPPGYASPVPVLWRSYDLASWTPVLEATMGCGHVENVVHGARGFVAIGSRTDLPNDDSMRAWVSRNGSDWHEAPQPPADYPQYPGLAVAPDGTFLEFNDEIWESTDGDNWFLSTPATNASVYEFASDLAIACGEDHCFALRLAAP